MTTSSTTTTNTTVIPPEGSNPSPGSGCRFIEALEKYTLKDIIHIEDLAVKSEVDDMQRNQSDPNFETGRCTTALASLCFSTIEQLGMILRTDLNVNTVKDAIKRGNQDNAISFFHFIGNNGLSVSSSDEIRAVYILYRNKITHNLFPKHGLGVSQNMSNLTSHIVININGCYSLNVNYLSFTVKNAINLIKRALCNSSNSNLQQLVDHNLQLIEQEEESVLKNQYHNPQLKTLQHLFKLWMPSFQF